jgi:hypothetical protein
MDPRIEHQCKASLGQIVMDWGFAEHMIEDLIAGMLGADISHVNALTANMATEYQIKSARGIGRLRFDDTTFLRLNTVLKYMERLAPFRNKLVHGFWSARDEDNLYTIASVKSGGTLRTQTEYVDLVYLQWMEKQVRALLTLLLAFGEIHDLIDYGEEKTVATPELLSALAGEDDPFLWVV